MQTQDRFPRSRSGVVAARSCALTTIRSVVPAAPRPLTKAEAEDLKRCEAMIHSGLDHIGKQLREIARVWCHIRDEKLYREEFQTIEAYTRARFGKSAHRLRQIVGAAGVFGDLEEDQSTESRVLTPDADFDPGDFLAEGPIKPAPIPKPRVLPTTESQVRALVPLAKPERIAAWAEAQVIAGPGKQPTAKDVAKAVHVHVREHERTTVKRETAVKPLSAAELAIAFAEERAFRSLSLLNESRRALKTSDLEPTQELYHAEKAEDHLGCLVKLLQARSRSQG